MKEKIGNEKTIDLSKFNITLGQYTRNGMKLLMARYNTDESGVISIALNKFFKTELSQSEIKALNNDEAIDDWVEHEMDANKGLVKIGKDAMLKE